MARFEPANPASREGAFGPAVGPNGAPFWSMRPRRHGVVPVTSGGWPRALGSLAELRAKAEPWLPSMGIEVSLVPRGGAILGYALGSLCRERLSTLG